MQFSCNIVDNKHQVRLEAEVAAQASKIAEQETFMASSKTEMEKLRLQNEDLARQLKEAKEELNKHSGMDAEFEKLRAEVA